MGRDFSKWLSLATRVARPEHYVQLTKSLKGDLAVWDEFLQEYKCQTCCQAAERYNGYVSLYTDASGSLDLGAIFHTRWCTEKWLIEWGQSRLCRNLTLLELFPIVVAIKIWDSRVCFWMDNIGVVSCITTLTSSSLPVLSLLRDLVLRCLEFNIWFRAKHVPKVDNKLADALSCF